MSVFAVAFFGVSLVCAEAGDTGRTAGDASKTVANISLLIALPCNGCPFLVERF